MELSLPFVFALIACGFFAGGLGALVGIGGGIVLVPTLVLGFGIDIRLAVACSLVSVVATSTAAGSVWVGKGIANMRLGMTLEVATTLGGISGGLLAASIAPSALSAIFAVLMAITAVLMFRGRDARASGKAVVEAALGEPEPKGHEEIGKLAGSYFDTYSRSLVHYEASRLPLGSAISFFAGIVSGMLGVGGGFIKVPTMNLGMGVPIKVAAATSNFMMGVTAVSSLFVYLARGLVHPMLAAPVALGVVGGALTGTAIASRTSPRLVRLVLSVLLVFVAVQMLLKSAGVSFGV